ncbi:MAG: hypothetical protein ACI38Y_06595 [Candidatus Methanomethylophilaceae archaeon]
MAKGERLDNMLDSVSDNLSDRVDHIAERIVSKKADSHKVRPWNDAPVQKYFPYFLIVCIVIWLISCIVTGADSFGEVIRMLCLIFVVGFAVLGLVGYRHVPSGQFPRWVLFQIALIIACIQWFIGDITGSKIYDGVIVDFLSFFGIEIGGIALKVASLLTIFMFTLFTTVGVLTVTVSYLRVYLLKVFKTMQSHTVDGTRGKAESFFAVPEIIDVTEVKVGPVPDENSFDNRSMFYLFMYAVVLGALISSYLFVNPYFLQSMSQRTMLTIMVMLTMFVPVLIIPWMSVKHMNARVASDAPREYRLWEGAKSKLFYTFSGLGVFMMMFIISLYFGFSLWDIIDNYLDFLIPLVLTSAMYAFVYANNFSYVLMEHVCNEFNEWKCGEDVEARRPHHRHR